MMLIYLIISACILAVVPLAKMRRLIRFISALFYILQAGFAVWVIFTGRGEVSNYYFTFDNLGVLFFLLLTLISSAVFYQSGYYLDTEAVGPYKLFNFSLILLCVSVAGVYFANNLALTWVFIELTTLATAGLVYHRKTPKSLEATWKYVFVSTIGIAIAYLGILMFSTAVTGEEGFSYAMLKEGIAGANPLYMKMAFLLVITGVSCKTETFPLYTVGVDANYAAPTPGSAIISTALVNAGFVAVYRTYTILKGTEMSDWACNVLIFAGLLSILVGAIYLRRTNNFKRFLTYSTVENMGIVLLGLGIGGAGEIAAILHVFVHSLVKSGMFLQLAQVGRLFGTYRMNRIGNYFNVYPLGAVAVVMGTIGLLAFPPSGLFISELLILKEMAAQGRWIILSLFVLLVCIILYTIARRLFGLLLRPADLSKIDPFSVKRTSTWLQLILLFVALLAGVWQPSFLIEFFNGIIN